MERLTDYLRVREAAAFLGVSPNTLRNWGRDGKITEFRHPAKEDGAQVSVIRVARILL